MAKSYPVIERKDGRVTVLARSAAEAHSAATEALGAGCTIVSVDKVRSGGIGGFFATELVRLVAAAPGAAPIGALPLAVATDAGDSLFTLPGGGEEFAARLASELAALTRTGSAAAEAVLGHGRATPRRALPPVAAGLPVASAAPVEDDVLPGDDALRWGADSDPVVPAEPVAGVEEELAIDWRAVFAAHEEQEEVVAADAPAPVPGDPCHGAEPAGPVEVIAHAEPPGIPSADEPSALDAPCAEDRLPAWFDAAPVEDDPLAGTAALLAEMLDAEYGLGERTITQRASAIRKGELPHGAEPPVPGGAAETGAVPGPPPDTADATPGWGLPGGDAERSLFVHPAVGDDVPPPAPTAWSAPTLRAFGVPDTVVGRIDRRGPMDDLDWTVGFMLAVRDLCGPLPTGPFVFAGPAAVTLAEHLGVSVAGDGDAEAAATRSVVLADAGPLELRERSAGRAVHLVIGDGWHHLAPVRPAVVSADGPEELLEALRVAEAWGAALGWVVVDGRAQRIDPYLLAGKLREVLPALAEVASPDGDPRR